MLLFERFLPALGGVRVLHTIWQSPRHLPKRSSAGDTEMSKSDTQPAATRRDGHVPRKARLVTATELLDAIAFAKQGAFNRTSAAVHWLSLPQ